MLNLSQEDVEILRELLRSEKRNIQVGFSIKFSKDHLEKFESLEERLESLNL